MKKQFWLPLLLLMICLDVFSQDSLDLGRTVHYLKKYLPNNRKWVVLDFYNTRCSSCISSFPRFDQLQKEFDDEIEIVLVCEDSISPEFRREYLDMRLTKQINNDTILPRLFKHLTVSHCVWLDPDLKVRGFTDKNGLSAANVLAFLEGKIDTLVTKRDLPRYYSEPPFCEFRFRSVLSGAIPRYKETVGGGRSDDGKISRRSLINVSLETLIHIAYGNREKQRQKIMKQLQIPKDTLLCYELVAPRAKKRETFYRYMRFDLWRYLNIRPKGIFSKPW